MFIQEAQGCCAVDEICELQHHDTPEEAMSEFCQGLMREEFDDRYNEGYREVFCKPAAFYLFTGVIKEGKRNKYYGQQFAAYIKRHKLGVVTESVARPNRVNHPDHLVRVWIWAPSETNLKKWWRKNWPN